MLDLVDYLEKCTFWVLRSKFDCMDGAKTVAKKLISGRGEIQLVHKSRHLFHIVVQREYLPAKSGHYRRIYTTNTIREALAWRYKGSRSHWDLKTKWWIDTLLNVLSQPDRFLVMILIAW